MKLSGRVAIVTGTSPNIGGGIAEALAATGAAVVAVDALEENAKDCAAAIVAAGGRAIGLTCDVTDEDAVRAAVARATGEFGQIDIVVNNAVLFIQKGVLEMSYAEWLRQTGIILGGAFLFTKYAVEDMRARGAGVVINVISTAGHQGEAGNIGYCTAKAGLLNFTRSAACELGPYGIRVVSLTPTATDPAEQYERARRWGRAVEQPDGLDAEMAPYAAKLPMNRMPKPSDYGAAAVFLASDEAALITGCDLRVDAGAVARHWAFGVRRAD